MQASKNLKEFLRYELKPRNTSHRINTTRTLIGKNAPVSVVTLTCEDLMMHTWPHKMSVLKASIYKLVS